MSKPQSFILDDPGSAIFRGVGPEDTRVMLSLTIYDLRVMAQMLALAAFPQNFAGQPGFATLQATAANVGDLMLHHMDEIWASLTPEERELGTSHTIDHPDD